MVKTFKFSIILSSALFVLLAVRYAIQEKVYHRIDFGFFYSRDDTFAEIKKDIDLALKDEKVMFQDSNIYIESYRYGKLTLFSKFPPEASILKRIQAKLNSISVQKIKRDFGDEMVLKPWECFSRSLLKIDLVKNCMSKASPDLEQIINLEINKTALLTPNVSKEAVRIDYLQMLLLVLTPIFLFALFKLGVVVSKELSE